MIEDQLSKVDQRVDAILLVGGFAASEYLKQRVEVLNMFPRCYISSYFIFKEQLRSRIRVIARPADADTATLRGAARYGLARRPLVSSIIAPRSYIMKVGLLLRLLRSHIQLVNLNSGQTPSGTGRLAQTTRLYQVNFLFSVVQSVYLLYSQEQ